jgi:enoyl-CoA hydratase
MLYDGLTGKAVAPATFWSDEYEMNSTLGHYPKPVVAYMSGITLGGGLGISGHGNVRIVTESSQVGMPETAIGLCPDVGGLHLLSRVPGEVGTHAALTGARFGPSDAMAAGLADHFVPAHQLDELTAQLRSGVFPAFDSIGLPPGELAAQRDWIDDCYGGDDIDAILDNLWARTEPEAIAAAELLVAMSPTAVKVTLQAIRRAASMTLDEVLEQDFVVGNHFLRHPDLAEGIRAQVIDKDRNPTWNPARLDEVSEADVAAFFEPLESPKALRLTTR